MNEKIEAGRAVLEEMAMEILMRISGRADAPGKLLLFPPELLGEYQNRIRLGVRTIVDGIIEECKADEGKPPAGE